MLDLCKLVFSLSSTCFLAWKKKIFFCFTSKRIPKKKSQADCDCNSRQHRKRININTSHIVLINLLLQMNVINFYFMWFEKIASAIKQETSHMGRRRRRRWRREKEKKHFMLILLPICVIMKPKALKFPKRSPIFPIPKDFFSKVDYNWT